MLSGIVFVFIMIYIIYWHFIVQLWSTFCIENFFRSLQNFGDVPVELLPFPSPRHVNGICRCVHTLARLDLYICPIKVILSVVTGWVMLIIAQWYNSSITLFFLENKTKNPGKTTGTIFKLQCLKKGLHFREQFYSSSEQISTSSKL